MRVHSHVAAVVTVRVDTRISLVQKVGVVRTIGTRASSTAGITTQGSRASNTTVVLSTSQASSGGGASGANGVSGVVLGSTSASSSSSLRVHSQVLAVVSVRVDPGIGLVQEVRVVRAVGLGSRARSTAVCAATNSVVV